MAKLSILIDDVDYKKLKQLALDSDVRFQNLMRDAVLSLLSADAPPTHSVRPPDLIKSLSLIAKRSAEVTRAVEELALSHGTNTGDLHSRAKAEAKEGRRIADRLGGSESGHGKTGSG